MAGVVHVDRPLASWGGNGSAAFAAGAFRQPGLGAEVHDAECAGRSSSSTDVRSVEQNGFSTRKLPRAEVLPSSWPLPPGDPRLVAPAPPPPPPAPFKAPPPRNKEFCAVCILQPKFHSCNICHRATCSLPTCMVKRCLRCYDEIIQRDVRRKVELELAYIEREGRGQGVDRGI